MEMAWWSAFGVGVLVGLCLAWMAVETGIRIERRAQRREETP